jgi:hypothetical protein
MKSIKAMVLAALSVVALVALPSAASASGGVVAGSYPATLHGSQVGSLVINLPAGGGEVSCGKGSSFEATLSKASSSLTTSSIKNPSNCGYGTSFQILGSCQLEFHPGAETVDIGPAGCGQAPVHAESCPGGNFLIQPQTLSAKYENLGKGSEANFRVIINDSSVTYTVTSNLCKGTGTFSDLAIKWQLNVTATDSGEKATGTSAFSGDLPHGLFLAGGSSEGEPRLASPEYPVRVKGERLALPGGFTGQITLIERPTWKVSCKVAQLDGGELSGPAYNKFSLNAAYSKCDFIVNGTSGGYENEISMPNCHYAYSNLKEVGSPVYAGTQEFACNSGTKFTMSFSGCGIDIPAQVFGGTAELTNLFTEVEGFNKYEGGVAAVMSATGVKYTTRGLCPLVGIKNETAENGSLHSDMLLKGVYPG